MVNKRKIKAILAESAFDPKEIGPLKVILESNDPNYFELRAIELIREAKNCVDYQDKIKMAISLLAMARIVTS